MKTYSFQARVARIQQIEKDILRIRQLLQSQAAEAEVSEQLFALDYGMCLFLKIKKPKQVKLF